MTDDPEPGASSSAGGHKASHGGATGAGQLPDIPPPPKALSRSTRRDTALKGNPAFRWLIRVAPIVFVAVGILFVVTALAIGARWKLAFDILIGDAAPDQAHHVSYILAALLAFVGYTIVPALIGAIVSAVVASVALRRITAQEADDAINKALARRR